MKDGSKRRGSSGTMHQGQNDGIPLYLKLASILREKIKRGHWELGEQLPTLPELQADYGVARATIRQAFGILQKEGLISSARGRGTFVTFEPQAQVQIPTYDPLGLEPGFRIEILKREACSACRDVGISMEPQSGPFIQISKRHYFNDKPYSLVDICLPRNLYDQLPSDGDQTQLYSQLIRDHTNIAGLCGNQTITIIRADFDTAAALDLPFSSPLAQILSRVLDETGETIMVYRVLIPSEFFLAERQFGDIRTVNPVTWRTSMRPTPDPETDDKKDDKKTE
ncbi:MAG: GntR family transcriptional regulator [Rhodobacteraceae bacterium]|nr:GntR family transcriptional regulator [Paracoccaceae bacterium]